MVRYTKLLQTAHNILTFIKKVIQYIVGSAVKAGKFILAAENVLVKERAVIDSDNNQKKRRRRRI